MSAGAAASRLEKQKEHRNLQMRAISSLNLAGQDAPHVVPGLGKLRLAPAGMQGTLEIVRGFRTAPVQHIVPVKKRLGRFVNGASIAGLQPLPERLDAVADVLNGDLPDPLVREIRRITISLDAQVAVPFGLILGHRSGCPEKDD
jgi:hypothetical protein